MPLARATAFSTLRTIERSTGAMIARLKARDFSSRGTFRRCDASSGASRVEVIHRVMTQVGQVAASCNEGGKEVFVAYGGVCDLKGHAHGPIQSGVRRIEKSSGRWRRLADKQQMNLRR